MTLSNLFMALGERVQVQLIRGEPSGADTGRLMGAPFYFKGCFAFIEMAECLALVFHSLFRKLSCII